MLYWRRIDYGTYINMLKRFLLIAFFCIAFLSNAIALSFSGADDVIRLDIFPQYEKISNEISNFDILAKVEIKKGWHLYWKNPGDTGEAVKPEYYVPDFLKVSSYEQSAPIKEKFEDIITSYIHKDFLYFKHSFNITEPIADNDFEFFATLKYSACKEECIPGEIRVNINLSQSKYTHNNDLYYKELDKAKHTFPQQISSTGYVENDMLYLKFNEQNLLHCNNITFISNHPKNNILATLPETVGFNKDKLLQIKFDEIPINYDGIILCDNNAYKITPDIFNNIVQNNKSIFYFIIIAFIAGLILNLMPCVLPILSLKALYILKHQKSSVSSALLYLFGVIASFILLSAILFYLRSKGEELGWGFQLQSPSFNIFLLIFFFVIFLLMSDIIMIPDRWTDYLSKISKNQSFLTGFFAVIIACPCTGPFMGAAIGYAISQPAIIYFSIFIFLAIGYALPYVLIELFPNIFISFLPKPGRWMITLKHFFAIPIALTCFWLGWVIFNQLSLKPYHDIYWEKYSAESVNEAIKNEQPVFINFTAKWCLVCLLNDKTSLATKEFNRLVRDKKLRLFKADWTKRDKEIKDALALYGRNSIPLYVYYSKGSKSPTILPQILTPKILSEAIN